MSAHARALHLHEVRFSWHRRAPDLLNIPELSVIRGEKLFLTGASGSGKTTLLGLMGGVLAPQYGEVTLLDHPYSRLRASQRDVLRAQHIGIIFQLFNLIPHLSAEENVLLPCSFSIERRRKALHDAPSLKASAHRLLDAMEFPSTSAHLPAAHLSVGQQQRVAAARALIGSPDLIIADEPTSALDAHTRDAFLKLLLTECTARRTTLIFVSHDVSLATHFDRHLHLHHMNRASPTCELS